VITPYSWFGEFYRHFGILSGVRSVVNNNELSTTQKVVQIVFSTAFAISEVTIREMPMVINEWRGCICCY
jgi:hypothetical protein